MLAQKLYTLRDQYIVVKDGTVVAPKLLRDRQWEGFAKEDVNTVFEYAHMELIDKLANYRDLDRAITQSQERELVFLLEAIIQARRLLKKTEED